MVQRVTWVGRIIRIRVRTRINKNQTQTSNQTIKHKVHNITNPIKNKTERTHKDNHNNFNIKIKATSKSCKKLIKSVGLGGQRGRWGHGRWRGDGESLQTNVWTQGADDVFAVRERGRPGQGAMSAARRASMACQDVYYPAALPPPAKLLGNTSSPPTRTLTSTIHRLPIIAMLAFLHITCRTVPQTTCPRRA